MRLRTATVLVLATLALTACAGDDGGESAPVTPNTSTPMGASTPLEIATSDWTAGDGGMEALFATKSVRLTVNDDECVVLRTGDGQRLDVVWPAGFTAVQTEEGPIILDAEGSTVVRSGSSLSASGGNVRANGQSCVGTRSAFHIQSELPSLD